MFESFENKPEEPKWIGPKVLIGAAASMLVSFGLCGVGLGLQRVGGMGVLGMLGFYLFGLSMLAAIVGGVMTVVEIIIAIARGK